MEAVIKKCSGIKLIPIAVAACLLYGISGGIRANYGILINSISNSSGVAYSSVSFILAVSQLTYGIAQPVFGVVAIKKSNTFVLMIGAVLMTIGLVSIPFCHSIWSLLFFLGIVFSVGTGAISFGIIMGAISPLMSEKESATVSGIVSAGSGIGSTVLSPIIQRFLSISGLQMTVFVLCVPIICIIPISVWLAYNAKNVVVTAKNDDNIKYSLKNMFTDAFQNKSYLFLMIGFFTCGFHMAIIETHLFSQFVAYGLSKEVAAYLFSCYGIAVIAGSILSGILGSKFPMKNVLGSIYASRVIIVILLLTLPKTVFFMAFVTMLLGLTAISTVPPTSGLVGKLFGSAKMATLFGVIFVSHQIGSFFSSWLGGISVQITKGYALIWIVSILFSMIAAIVSFAIKDKN